MRIEILISDQQIADTLERAGSRYWVERLRFEDIGDAPSCWHALVRGKISRVVVFLNEPHEGETRKAVTLDTIRAAVALIADCYPQHMGGVCGDLNTADATTGDALLQCATLGALVYG